MTKVKQPVAPRDRGDTIRKLIMKALEENVLSAKDLSGEVRISEKEVYDHLQHIQRSVSQDKDREFIVVPAECNKCGFVFKKRDRLKKPTKCPVCKQQSISLPLFSIRKPA
jgi:predicted Zn-ribbon and HTH transcriptional regulator